MSNSPSSTKIEKALIGENILLSAMNNRIFDFIGYFNKQIIVASYDKQAYLPTLNVYCYDKNKKQAQKEIFAKIYKNYSKYEFILVKDQTKIYLSKIPSYKGDKLKVFENNNLNVDFIENLLQEKNIQQNTNQQNIFKEMYQTKKTSFSPI